MPNSITVLGHIPFLIGVNIPMVDIVARHYKCILMHSDKHFNLLAKHTGLKAMEVIEA
jgi:hypothetical protein